MNGFFYKDKNINKIHQYLFEKEIKNQDLKKIFCVIPFLKSSCKLPFYMKEFLNTKEIILRNIFFKDLSIIRNKINKQYQIVDFNRYTIISSFYQKYFLKDAFEEAIKKSILRRDFEKIVFSFKKIDSFLNELLSIIRDIKQTLFWENPWEKKIFTRKVKKYNFFGMNTT